MERTRNEKLIDNFLKDVSKIFDKKTVESAARKTKFVQRGSKLTGHLFLTVFIFGMSIYGTPTLEQLVGLLNIAIRHLNITREGLHQRINDYAVKFFEYMIGISLSMVIPSSFDVNLLNQFNKVIILDSTSFQVPEELSEIFPGSGGSASNAAIKIQFGYDIKSSEFFYIVQSGNSADNKVSNNFVEKLEAGDLTIRDLGYFNINTFGEIDENGAFYLGRLRTDVNVYQEDESGKLVKLDLVKFIEKMQNTMTEIEVYLKNGDTVIKTRLVIEKVPDSVLGQRLRRLNKIAKKKGSSVKKATKALQSVNLYISNIPVEYLSGRYFRILYCIRWQIELIFKNWKSNFSLDEITGYREARVKCMIYAKLLMIFVTTKLTFWVRNYVWVEKKKEVSEYRLTKQLLVRLIEWYRTIHLEPKKIISFLKDTFDYLSDHCYKIKQKDRRYPLELLSELSIVF